MKSIKFTLGLTVESVNKNYNKEVVEIELPLEGQFAPVKTKTFKIIISKIEYEAYFQIPYQYDSSKNFMKLYNEKESVCLMMREKGTKDYIEIYTDNFLKSSFDENINILNDSIKEIIDHISNLGYHVSIKSTIPDLESLFQEDMVHESTDKNIVEEFKQFKRIVESTGYHVGKLAKNARYANVIGSSSDPKPHSNSWMKLWKSEFGETEFCSSENEDCGESNKLVGGHCILGEVAKIVKNGSNDVFIIPICPGHNKKNNIFMTVQKNDGNVIWLENYMD